MSVPSTESVATRLKARAIKLLARREHSRAELKRKLSVGNPVDDGFSDELLASVLDQLADDGYQSDERFTELLIRQQVAKGYGELDIAARLYKKGIGKSLAATSLKDFVAENNVDWYAQATDVLIQRSMKSGRQSNCHKAASLNADQRLRQRLIRFLQQRGFTHDQVLYALKHAVVESEEENL